MIAVVSISVEFHFSLMLIRYVFDCNLHLYTDTFASLQLCSVIAVQKCVCVAADEETRILAKLS